MELIAQGMTSELPIDEYHDMPAVSSTGLKVFIRKSPAHYFDQFRAEDRVRPDKLAFRVGRAWHCAVFEPHAFDARFVTDHDASKISNKAKVLAQLLALDVAGAKTELAKCIIAIPDDIKASTKDGKALYAEKEAAGLRPMPASEAEWIVAQLSRMHGKDVLSEHHIENVKKMAAVAHAKPVSRVLFGPMLSRAQIERSMTIRDPATGLMIKWRPDYQIEPCESFPCGFILDGKSTIDASRSGFGRQAWGNDYGLQAALYTKYAQLAWGTSERPTFAWLAQEKERPYVAKYYYATRELLAYWDAKIESALEAFARCEATGIWPDYGDEPEDVTLPGYAENAIENALGVLDVEDDDLVVAS